MYRNRQAMSFRTDYLLKVFDYNPQAKTFEEATLEDQIDRERLLSDEKLRRDFKAWLLDPAHLKEFDRGTILIPREFLANSAIAPTPIGFAASACNRPSALCKARRKILSSRQMMS